MHTTKIRCKFLYYLLSVQKLFEMKSFIFSDQHTAIDPVLQIDWHVPVLESK